MDTSEKMRMALISDELHFMAYEARLQFGGKDDPVVLAIAIAVTSAQTHPDIEAHVVCKNTDQLIEVASVLAGMSESGAAGMIGSRVDLDSGALEFPNGSAVRVILRVDSNA